MFTGRLDLDQLKLKAKEIRIDLIKMLFKAGSGHTAGPLAQGISQAVGFALAAKIDKQHHHVFCLMGDGELDEGQVWEAFMFAAKEKLGNLIAIIDRNHIQLDGTTEEIMPLEPLKAKLLSFIWQVLEMDGHNLEEITVTLMQAKVPTDKPVAVIAHTIPGKGVSFMECKSEWHGKVPNEAETKQALRELNQL